MTRKKNFKSNSWSKGSNMTNDAQFRRRKYYNYYYDYLRSIILQMFKWENLPETVDPRYMEMSLYDMGYVALYNNPDKKYGMMCCRGAVSQLNYYNQPVDFKVAMNRYTTSFKLYNYGMTKEPHKGILIGNNDLRKPLRTVIELFAHELAELKEVTRMNILNQRMPYIIKGSEKNMLSLRNMFQQVQSGNEAVFVDEEMQDDSVSVFNLNAPFVVPQLDTHQSHIFNEIMGFLGINNANTQKKERMVTDEVNANNSQVINSGNVFLKSRLEGCELYNTLYKDVPEIKDINVIFREEETANLISQMISTTGGDVRG